MTKKLAAGLVAFTIATGACAGVAWAKNTDNDRVLSGEKQEYIEYFKTDKRSCNKPDCKNYLYTATELPAPPPGKCIVVSGDSEKTLAISCNYGQG